MITVLVADDHDLVRAGLVRMLQESAGIDVVGQAGSGEEAVERSLALRPDVIMMDVRMPGMDGLAATRTILRCWPEARIIAVTSCDDDVAARRLIDAGALGYVTKDAALDALLTAIKRACRGKQYLSQGFALRLARPLKAVEAGPFGELSGRELEICRQVVAGRRAKDIARRLYITSQTVHTYRYRIFEKLGIHSDVELTRLAIEHGLMSESPDG